MSPHPAGPASGVDDISALPNNQTSIIATWLCPLFVNTYDPALLRYTLTYQRGISVDSGEVPEVGILPTLLEGAESEDCLVEVIVSDLSIGTTYALKVVAVAPGGVTGDVADAVAVATTFGTCKLQ